MKNSTNENDETPADQPAKTTQSRSPHLTSRAKLRRIILAAIFVILFVSVFWIARHYLDLNEIVERETALKTYYRENPAWVLIVAFLFYTLVVALTIPIATFMSLLYAWFFGFTWATILISFASTLGATIAFLGSRYIFRDLIQTRFGDRLETVNSALDKEGSFYLFTLRLAPVIPFWAVNLLMGLTKMKVTTFWWVSQLGMLAITTVFAYGGSRIPDLKTLQEQGIKAVFSPWQLTQLMIVFALIGILPFAVRKLVLFRRARRRISI